MAPNAEKITLPVFFSHGMVIQRNAQVKIWGWAAAGEALTLTFMGKSYSTTVDENRAWSLRIRTGNAGGPYEMTIRSSSDTVTIHDILLGDVWLCSGQSNMEMRLGSLIETYPDEIARSKNDCIRQFLVPADYDFDRPRVDYEAGSWVKANPETVLNFTAVGYFYAQKLHKKYRVPIGLINASLGGAPIESFMSEEALKSFPEVMEEVRKLKDRQYVEFLQQNDEKTKLEWYRQLDHHDAGMSISSSGKWWIDPDCDDSSWPKIQVPSYWEDEGLGCFNGSVWFRKQFQLPASLVDKRATLYLGNIVDEDVVYVNGKMIGTSSNQYEPRKYTIPEDLLHEGINTIVVRVINFAGKGGFYKGKPYHLQIGNETIPLSGQWKYQIGAKLEPMPPPAFVQWRPLGLYNAMIAPIVQYLIRGVIWYQGESNVGRWETYESMLKALITDWRKKWEQDHFPFLIVQLPNYLESSSEPIESNWAQLREAQRRTLALPHTGMAVTIDIGEWNDIHPVNKKDVGYRLALYAQKIAYGDESEVWSGPMLESATRNNERICLSFSNVGSGLIAKGDDRLKHFAIAGEDLNFVWADAMIEGDRVIVWNDQVQKPLYVRYAWADNPVEANLYNAEGLPASPFSVEIK